MVQRLNIDIKPPQYPQQLNYIPAATSSTLNLTGLTNANDNNKYYRCIAKTSISYFGGTIYYSINSNIVQLTVPS